jgi:hypothetical protein
MTSTFTWLDFSEHARRKMLDVISAFGEKETRDELGIGVVRDAFADMLFPGTSTIQTRAKYFLFVPWIYVGLEKKRTSSYQVAERARHAEIALINALVKSEDSAGTIGVDARQSLQRLPSNIYWNGLDVWGIRLFKGSQNQYHRYLDSFYVSLKQTTRNDDGEPAEGNFLYNWQAGLPSAPVGFPEKASFRLNREEANFLYERIKARVSGTLLAFLVDLGHKTSDIPFPWQHPLYADFPKHIQEQLGHGRNFSEVIHGAALLYNLMLAEKAKANDLRDEYHKRSIEWYTGLDNVREALDQWDRLRFWAIIEQSSARVSRQTHIFIEEWLTLALSPDKAKNIADDAEARRLIHNRESFLKRNLARLDNPRALELWRGDAGTNRLDYRWRVSQTIILDIVSGLI